MEWGGLTVSKYLLANPQIVELLPYVFLFSCEMIHARVILMFDDLYYRWQGCLPLCSNQDVPMLQSALQRHALLITLFGYNFNNFQIRAAIIN